MQREREGRRQRQREQMSVLWSREWRKGELYGWKSCFRLSTHNYILHTSITLCPSQSNCRGRHSTITSCSSSAEMRILHSCAQPPLHPSFSPFFLSLHCLQQIRRSLSFPFFLFLYQRHTQHNSLTTRTKNACLYSLLLVNCTYIKSYCLTSTAGSHCDHVRHSSNQIELYWCILKTTANTVHNRIGHRGFMLYLKRQIYLLHRTLVEGDYVLLYS